MHAITVTQYTALVSIQFLVAEHMAFFIAIAAVCYTKKHCLLCNVIAVLVWLI